MNDQAGSSRGPRRAGALAVVAAVAVLTACGGSPSSSGGSASTAPATYRADLAYAQCMQTHGVPDFPDPNPSADISISGQPHGNSPAARANDACEHLLPAGSTGTGGATAPTTASSPGTAATDCVGSQPCYTPRQFRVAYGIQPLLDRGIGGHGVTVALPEEAETGPAQTFPAATDIRHDVADFDSRFGLPPARIQVITTLAGSSASPWLAGLEEVEDTELVHAVAPDATIREILVDPAEVSTPAKLAATFAAYVRIAVRYAAVMSQSGIGQDFSVGEDSFTGAEVATMNSALEYAAARHVTVVAASGDYGVLGEGSSTPVKQVILPASDPLVLGVGGTSLTANPVTGAYISETAWNTPGLPRPPGASGGGFSRLFARPAYQNGVPGIGASRGVPDVAADGSGPTGMALAFSAPGGRYELVGAGGTSAGAPFWAGLIALADQEAGHPLGFVNPAIYRIARGPLYHKAFHDITTGNNTVVLTSTSPPVTITGYQAGPGWDPVTGWGTPDAQVLIPLLAR
ncbi:MAG TPA: S53 family peptidase [Streptosporangiaceae bacterium]|nr:S53 family peptidase [Streptosporangiaceae bacterium]